MPRANIVLNIELSREQLLPPPKIRYGQEMETTNFYKEGIKGLQLQLRLRSVEAMEHWQGITELQSYELIERLVRMMSR